MIKLSEKGSQYKKLLKSNVNVSTETVVIDDDSNNESSDDELSPPKP